MSPTEGAAPVGQEVLVVDGDENARRAVTKLFEGAGLTVTALADPERARDQITHRFFQVALIDLDTPTPAAGIELVKFARKEAPSMAAIVLSKNTAFEAIAPAFRAGATDVIPKSDESGPYLLGQVLAAAAAVKANTSREDLIDHVAEVHDEFLREMMGLSRQVADLEEKLLAREGDMTSSLVALGIMNVLFVDDESGLGDALERALTADKGWRIRSAQSGGEALDSASQTTPHVLVVKEALPDLPGGMVIKSVRANAPEVVSLLFTPPGDDGRGNVRMVDDRRSVLVIESFGNPAQLVTALEEVREGLMQKARERRYLHVFRKQHFAFLKRYNTVRQRLDKAKK